MSDPETSPRRPADGTSSRQRPVPPADRDRGDSITGLLGAWRRGFPEAAEDLMARIYPQLCAMAAARLPRDGRTWTLQPTEVVHEAYHTLRQQRVASWRNQAQFFRIAARIMRRVILDHGRRRNRQKRGAGRPELRLSQILELAGPTERPPLDDLLADLARIEARAARVVELRVDRGMSAEEVAAALNVSPRTVARDWRFARAWLRHQLASQPQDPPSTQGE